MLAGLSWSTLAAFSGTCLVIELTPGPNMAYLAVLSADKGRRAGFAAVAGVALGLLIVGLAAGLGLSALVDGSFALYESLRWGGVLFLLFLSWEAWHGDDEAVSPIADVATRDVHSFIRGLVTNLLNPKAAIFYVALLPTFIDARYPLAAQAVTLSLVYVAIATAVHCSIVMLASGAKPWLDESERAVKARRVMSLALVAIAVWMLLATRR